ncbi:MAG: DUF2130 domain-containing protein [Patescibacteria group bacterium]
MAEVEKLRIICPKCQAEISIDEALRGQLVQGEKDKAEKEYQGKLEAEKKKLWAMALVKAEERSKAEGRRQNKELEFLKEQLEIQKKKRTEAEEVERKLRKEKLELEESKKSFELEKQRQLDEERAKIREETSKKADEDHRLKEAEWQKKFEDMKKSYDDVKRKMEQGSQQTQGEVLELELEEMLRAEFAIDEITPVSKGITGADIIQVVRDQTGHRCGLIAWELKRTKAWSEGWVIKLKDDMRKVRAEIAILVTEVLPDGIVESGYYNGIYVSVPRSALSLAKMLRLYIIKLSALSAIEEGKSEKKDVIYNYLCGTEFRGRVEAIVESTVALKESLDRERRAYQKLWSEREKQIERVESNMIGMYGDMQGIAGRTLPQIKSLELEPERDPKMIAAKPVKQDRPKESGTAQQLHFAQPGMDDEQY